MEVHVTKLLNVLSNDEKKLADLVRDYFERSDRDDESDSEPQSDSDDNDEQFDFAATDCDVALQQAVSLPDAPSASEEAELQKVQEFRYTFHSVIQWHIF